MATRASLFPLHCMFGVGCYVLVLVLGVVLGVVVFVSHIL